ncbi:Fpg/Nei family DNA glycosylase [Streptomyces hoynatensis]|uniref:Fpg/Nei family DNA glycosylase n=1 Tax=Streptomyces hoynatensis TaxID=1141874 RepID=A0A3A9Z6D2_9ACTN|nr:DNA-formamidopyrimidine glycosylase family protein [Streptomyces hoynatensis]RKN43875.1 Fpg/Nei family DNA glycosylase [Streptomyces hoynatensis]
MPELPDVEGFRGTLAECARGRRITGVQVGDKGVLHGVTAARLGRELTGRRFTEPERRGKWLLAHTEGPTVLLHFGMTGSLVCAAPGEPPGRHDRVGFALDDGRWLRYRDQRKLRGLWFADSDDAAGRVIGDQGPDALGVGREELDALLRGRRGRIKSALLDQSLIAGLGNLLGDEILWRARLNPARPAGDLSDGERRRLAGALRKVLREAVPTGRVPPRRSWLTGRRYDKDPACPRCGTPLEHGRVAGRGTVWCPHCQPDS